MPLCGPAAPRIPRHTPRPPLGSFTAQVASANHRCVDLVARTVQSALSHSHDNPLLSTELLDCGLTVGWNILLPGSFMIEK